MIKAKSVLKVASLTTLLSQAPGVAISQTVTSTGFATGNNLLESCTAPTPLGAGLCSGYLQGVADTQIGPNFKGCLPEGTQMTQLKDAVVNYLRAYPAVRSEKASLVVLLAIQENWNCPQIAAATH